MGKCEICGRPVSNNRKTCSRTCLKKLLSDNAKERNFDFNRPVKPFKDEVKNV